MGMTKQRSIVLNEIMAFDGHPTVEDIYRCVREKHPSIGMATVYRNLNLLSDSGEILRLQISNAPVRFDKNTHPHEHMVCLTCGAVVDIKDVLFSADYTAPEGAKVLRCDLTFYGLCADCASAETNSNASA